MSCDVSYGVKEWIKAGRRSFKIISWDKEITCETQIVIIKMRESFRLLGN